jgi:MoaA/NifB/PqqE/SkfB family radical SAM enzyme
MKTIPIRVISTQNKSELQIRFFPTDICNFNCSYCFAGSHDNVYRYPKNLETTVKNFRKLFDKYNSKTKFNLIIAGGGEPTMWPKLELFCKEIKKEHNVYITLVTNGSRTIRWWGDNLNAFDSVILSCHHEEVDLDHYINVADLLFDNGINVNALMLMSSKHWDKCVSYINKMKKSKHQWFIEAKPIVDTPGEGTEVYTQEQKTYIQDSIKRIPNGDYLLKRLGNMRVHESIVLFDDNTAIPAQGSTIIINDWNKFKDWKCNVGIESISIIPSGKLTSSCGIDIFDKVYNIFDKNFDIVSEPNQMTCTFSECSCQPDTHVSKFKI